MPEFTPSISMSRKARYVTQSSIWDAQITGPLTSRRIAKYQAAGWYDGVKRDPATSAKVNAANRARRNSGGTSQRTAAKLAREAALKALFE